MEWIKSEHRIKHELYNSKEGYYNYNIYYCSNCGYSKVIRVGSQNRIRSCPLCHDNNINVTCKCHKENMKRNNNNNSWKFNRKQYRVMLAEKLNYQCECCRNTFSINDLVIHHIVPHKGDINLMHDFNNMYLCCHSCHTLIHKRLSALDETSRSDCLKAIKKSIAIKHLSAPHKH